MRRVGGAKNVFHGQDCPLLDSRLRGNDTVGVASTALTLSLSKSEGFRTARTDGAAFPGRPETL